MNTLLHRFGLQPAWVRRREKDNVRCMSDISRQLSSNQCGCCPDHEVHLRSIWEAGDLPVDVAKVCRGDLIAFSKPFFRGQLLRESSSKSATFNSFPTSTSKR
jgi:hypothetical protein